MTIELELELLAGESRCTWSVPGNRETAVPLGGTFVLYTDERQSFPDLLDAALSAIETDVQHSAA